MGHLQFLPSHVFIYNVLVKQIKMIPISQIQVLSIYIRMVNSSRFLLSVLSKCR